MPPHLNSPDLNSLPTSTNSVPLTSVGKFVFNAKQPVETDGIVLGKGAFGAVTGNTTRGVAIKRIDDTDALNDERTANEAIARFLQEDTRNKFTTLYSRKELLNLEVKGRDKLLTKLCSRALTLTAAMKSPSWDRMELFKYVARAGATVLSEMHLWGWRHRDIKPDNIMICEDPLNGGVYTARVVDFGVACTGRVCRTTSAGTPTWMPTYYPITRLLYHYDSEYDSIPSLCLYKLVRDKVDMSELDQDKFSLGMTLAVIAEHKQTISMGYGWAEIVMSLLRSEDWPTILRHISDFDRDDPLYRGVQPPPQQQQTRANNAPDSAGNAWVGGKKQKNTIHSKWVSTGRKVASKDGQKVLYENPGFPRQLRIKKMRKGRDGKLTAIYVAHPK